MVILVIALSLDSLGVGVAYGLRGIRLPWLSYLVIALCTGLLMGLSMVAGQTMSSLVPADVARAAGGLTLVGVGAWQLYQGWTSYRHRLGDNGGPWRVLELGVRPLGLVVHILVEPASADTNRSGEIDVSESLALGLALGLDALVAGFGAAMTGFPLAIVIPVAAACVAFVRGGLALGRLPVSDWVLRKGFALPGILIIWLGLLRL